MIELEFFVSLGYQLKKAFLWLTLIFDVWGGFVTLVVFIFYFTFQSVLHNLPLLFITCL